MVPDVLKISGRESIIEPKDSDFIDFGKIKMMKGYVNYRRTDESKGPACHVSQYRAMEIAEALGCRLPTAAEACLAYRNVPEISNSTYDDVFVNKLNGVESEWTCDIRMWKDGDEPFILRRPEVRNAGGKFKYAGGKKMPIRNEYDDIHKILGLSDMKDMKIKWMTGSDIAPFMRRIDHVASMYLEAVFGPEDSRSFIGFRLVKE